MMHRICRAVALATLALMAAASPAAAALRAPAPIVPAADSATELTPYFGWNAVAGADHYQFQLAADPRFNSLVVGGGGGGIQTNNVFATIDDVLADGEYYWRVRAIGSTGAVSDWSTTRHFTKAWTTAPEPLSPTDAGTITYPDVLTLKWTKIPGAWRYRVVIATDPGLASIVAEASSADNTQDRDWSEAQHYTPVVKLPPGRYYWAVTPVDAGRHSGHQSTVWSFDYVWNTTTQTAVEDLDTAPEVYDPRVSWNPIAGASKYDLEINVDSAFAAGSKVCCVDPVLGTSYSYPDGLASNTYYWRVRARDTNGNAGDWNIGPSFKKDFDRNADTGNLPIKNLRMIDNDIASYSGSGTDKDTGTVGYQTYVPAATWDRVPGAAMYEVEIRSGATCSNAIATRYVATNAWAPLAKIPIGWEPPMPTTQALFDDETSFLSAGTTYCLRVRAYQDKGLDASNLSKYVIGDWTTIDNDGNTSDGIFRSFTYLGAQPEAALSPPSVPMYLAANQYRLPATGSTSTQTPWFTWATMNGAKAYWVEIARDPSFTTIVEVGYTEKPIFVPHSGGPGSPESQPQTFNDETTSYYWAVWPVDQANNFGVQLDPAHPTSFQKQSIATNLVAPTDGETVGLAPTFKWGRSDWARRYRLQIATTSTFAAASVQIDREVDGTSFTVEDALPADAVLYWRVGAVDWRSKQLAWSTPRTFRKSIPVPVPSATNPTTGDGPLPWLWQPLQGVTSYELELEYPDGSKPPKRYQGLQQAGVTFLWLEGSGIWRWKVRAHFPSPNGSDVTSPWTATQPFANQMPEPINLGEGGGTGRGDGILLHWDPRPGAKSYRVEISLTPDFARVLESKTAQTTAFAPLLKATGLSKVGGQLWWRVMVVDSLSNRGDVATARPFKLPKLMTMKVTGQTARGTRTTLLVKVTDSRGKAIRGIVVRASGVGRGSGRTNAKGIARLRVRPSRAGTLTITASRSGYRTVRVLRRVS